MKNTTVLYVSPVPRIPTQGRDKQTFTTIDPKTGQLKVSKTMNKTKEFGAGYRMGFMLNFATNKFQTGMEESCDNPFYNLDAETVMSDYGLDHNWSSEIEKVVKQKRIKIQTLYEILDKQVPGFYTSDAISGNVFQYSKAHKENIRKTFIETFYIVLYDGPNRFTDETARGRLAIQLLKNHNKIAHSKNEINPSFHSFYISEENEAEMDKMRKQDILDKAIALKYDLYNNMSEYKAYQVGVLCTNVHDKSIVSGVVSRDETRQKINNYLEPGSNQMSNANQFISVTELLKKKEDRIRFEVLYLIQQAFNTNVLFVNNGFIVWHSKQGTPQHKFSDRDKLTNLIHSELLIYNPEDSETSNLYGDLVTELKNKGVRIE